MKKFFKIFGWTLLSLVVVAVIAVSVVVWVVFTPEKLTPIVRSQIPNYVTCETEIDEVDLTFFSTFPKFGLRISDVLLKTAPSDTLASVHQVVATMDVASLVKKNAVVIDGILVEGGKIFLYTDSTGKVNYDILVPSEEEVSDTSAFVLPFDGVNLSNVALRNVCVAYVDEQMKLDAKVNSLDLGVAGNYSNEDADLDANLSIDDVCVQMNDSSAIQLYLPKLKLAASGTMKGDDAKAEVDLELPNVSFAYAGDQLLDSATMALKCALKASLSDMQFTILPSAVEVEGHKLSLDGNVAYLANGSIPMNINFRTAEAWDIAHLLTLVPEAYASLLDGITAEGMASIAGAVHGVYADSVLPNVDVQLELEKGRAKYADFPYVLSAIKASLGASLDLNDGGVSSATIKSLSAVTGKSSLTASGTVDDLLGAMRCNLRVGADLKLPELYPLLPDSMQVEMQGSAKANAVVRFALDDVLELNLNKIKANGNVCLSDLNVVYEDSMLVQSPKLCLAFDLPSKRKESMFKELVTLNAEADDLYVEMVGMLNAQLSGAILNAGVSNFMDTTKMLSAQCDFDMQHLVANMDTIHVDVHKPQGNVVLMPSRRNEKNPHLRLTYASESLLAQMGQALDLRTKAIQIGVAATYDEKAENIYLKWNPRFNIDFNDGKLQLADVATRIEVPAIKMELTPRKFTISDSRIVVGNSDFSLSGELNNIRRYMKGEGLLAGDFRFVSDNTDVNELMDLVSGFGSESDTTASEVASVEETEAATDSAADEGDPFMVPLGVDIAFDTNIKNAVVSTNNFQNVGGRLTVKNGVLTLEQMGFTSNAAEMQLTAMYRSERKNHLFAGIDFHLLDIDIAQLIHLVPDIDTIMPMLKSFEGKAQFHLAAETYMKSNYDLKLSTLRGAAAIEGKDLVLMDSEMFAKIAKPLLFSRKTRNLVDSISVEATVFRNEVDLYPFVMSMDKYTAVVGGRYDLNNNYNAHIETLSPIRLALRVSGNASDLDNMNFDLVKTKYSNMYKPEKRNVTQERTLALKNMISEALKANVKTKEEDEEGN